MAITNDTKRKRTIIDLTGDASDDDVPASKTQRLNNPSSSQPQHSANATAHHVPPTSSAPSGSQPYRPFGSSGVPVNSQHSVAERDAWLATNVDADDLDEIVSGPQDGAENDELQLYGDLPTKIVGVQYYRGIANAGEYILMRREPGNPYDKNAIRIDNVVGEQIGHIPKRIAEKLSKYMDKGWLCCEGRLAGAIGPYDCPLVVNMLGPDPTSEAGRQLSAKMLEDKLPTQALKEAQKREKERMMAAEMERKRKQQEENKRLAEARRAAANAAKGARAPSSSQPQGWSSQGQPGPGPSTQPVMEELLEASQRFDPRALNQATDQYGLQEEALQNMPLATKPASIKTEMLPYQLQALKWLLDQENPQVPPLGSQESVQLWKRHDREDNAFTNIATSHPCKGAPTFASGGILADDMGLGKTLEMISLLVADAEKHGRGTTLVVAPLSVMSNWSGQIAHHVHEDKALKVYTYHGAGRTALKAEDFAQYDVAITTYQTLASDYMPRGKAASTEAPQRRLRSTGLYSMNWRRVILDEGHTIRNPSSKGAAAVTALMARSRWALTGTPIINSLRDLFCLLRFIGITGGLERLEVFNSVLIRPLKNNEPTAVFLLQAIMNAFTLRRRKEMAFIDLRLPKLDEYVHKVDFTEKEKERYMALATEAKGVLSGVLGKGKEQTFAHLLEVLLRMRQCCNHWQLCGERVTKLLEQLQANGGTVDLNPETKKALQDVLQLQIESQEECAVCLEPLHNPVITTCSHAFGQECIARVIETQHKCPMCRAPLPDTESTLVYPSNEHGDEFADDDMDLTQSSSKLEGLMQILAATKASGKGEKTVIFSQWTRFLNIVQARLEREGGWTFCRLDGTMNVAQRDQALHSLEHNPDCAIMLASLGVCAVGLNLTAANQIVLSDSWWAPAIEDQAVDRVHRLGQKRETRVLRLVVEGTIEEQVLEIQREKRKLMNLAFREKDGKRGEGKAKVGRLRDIQRMLGSQVE